MRIVYVIAFLLTGFIASAQKKVVIPFYAVDKQIALIPDSLSKTTDGIAKYINANFTGETDKVRAAFVFTATHIDYDIDNMFAINLYEKQEEKITKALRTGKGICENYAAVFNDVCLKLDIRSLVVTGYTRQNGFVDYLPHAWCAALVNHSWFLFDPTWGSGFIRNNQFTRKLDNKYFMTSPADLLKSHMPFDMMYEFSYYPITNQQFYEGKVKQDSSRPYFNYNDTLATYEALDHIGKLRAGAARIERNGVKNGMIFDRLRHIKMEIESEQQNRTIALFNAAVANYNEGVNFFNEFIAYRNKQFTPLRPDKKIQGMLDTVATLLTCAKARLDSIEHVDANTGNMVSQMRKSGTELTAQLKEQQTWLTAYFKKNKVARRTSFYDVTFYGVPLGR